MDTFKALKTSILAISLITISSHASSQSLAGDEIKKFVGGKTVLLKTTFGKFPLVYRNNGLVTGDGSSLGLAKFFAPSETGKWWVKGPKLCQQWPTWYKGKPLCFTINKTGAKSMKWVRDDGYSGTAIIR